MKPTLLLATFSLVIAMPQAFAATKTETRTSGQGKQSTAQVQKSKTSTSSKSASDYTVRKGDCMDSIARRSGCSTAKLAQANGLKTTSLIHPGQTLKVPATVSKTVTTAKPTAIAKTEAVSGKSYKVLSGDTFAAISKKQNVPVDSLIAANPQIKPTALRPGQLIRLPQAKSASTPAPVAKPEARIAAHAPATRPAPLLSSGTTTTIMAEKSPEKPTPAEPSVEPAKTAENHTENTTASTPETQSSISPNSPEKKIRSVMIEGEMTYGEFADKHGTDTTRLNDLNGLDLTKTTVLAKGSELYVPAQP